MNSRPRLTDEEWRLVRDASFFRTKASVMEKIKGELEELRAALRDDLKKMSLLAPEGVDLEEGQLVKGEHLMECPYLYLDLPKYFSGGEKFTYRTLFWWGHHLLCTLILDGRHLDRYKENVMARYEQLAEGELHLLMTETPWEWRRGGEFALPLTKKNRQRVERALRERPFLKLHRYWPLDDPAMVREGLVGASRRTFAVMALAAAP